MVSDIRTLPLGVFINYAWLPEGTTEENLSAYFKEHGFAISPDCISVKQMAEGCKALVSVPNQIVVDQINAALAGHAFRGKRAMCGFIPNRVTRQ